MASLDGKRILVTRSKEQGAPMVNKIEGLGGVAIHLPLLTFQVRDHEVNKQVLKQLHDFSWVFFTSSNGVKFFFELLSRYSISFPPDIRIAIVGSKTKEALLKYGAEPDFVPSLFQGSVMVEDFAEEVKDPGRVLYVRGNRSSEVIPSKMESKGIFFESLTAYDTLLMEEGKDALNQKLRKHDVDALTFTSPSTILAFCQLAEENYTTIPCFCIGPTTASEAEAAGFQLIRQPEQYTIDHLLQELIYFFSEGDR